MSNKGDKGFHDLTNKNSAKARARAQMLSITHEAELREQKIGERLFSNSDNDFVTVVLTGLGEPVSISIAEIGDDKELLEALLLDSLQEAWQKALDYRKVAMAPALDAAIEAGLKGIS